MPAQYFSQNTDVSSLQWKILKYIATHNNSDYKGVANELEKKRTTIFESVKSLKKKGYVDANKEDATQRNSKVILRLTREGKDYLGGKKYLYNTSISNYDILLSETDSNVRDFLQILRKANDSNLLEDMMEPLKYHLHSAPIADKKGKMRHEDNISAIKEAFFEGLPEIAQNPNYDLKAVYFNDDKVAD